MTRQEKELKEMFDKLTYEQKIKYLEAQNLLMETMLEHGYEGVLALIGLCHKVDEKLTNKDEEVK